MQVPNMCIRMLGRRARSRKTLTYILLGLVVMLVGTDIGQTLLGNVTNFFGDSIASAGPLNPQVATYMEAKANLIQRNRKNFLLWDYFDLSDALYAKDVHDYKWQDLINERFVMWVKKQQATGDIRHSLEKDKCVTMEVLNQLKLKHPKVRVMWNETEFSETKLKAFLLTSEYPAILKVGHIHQQKSTLFLPSSTEVLKHVDEYVSWTNEKMHSHFIDNNPRWKDNANILYAALHPCTFIQDVVNPEDFHDGQTARPWEVMVEVLFLLLIEY